MMLALRLRSARRTSGRGGRWLRPRMEWLECRDLPSTLVVTNSSDRGPGSLRDAISHAKDGDTVNFDPGLVGRTIALTSDGLAIRKSIDIQGPGADKLTVSGSDRFRVFDISEGNTVTIAGLTISHGRAGESGGGGILNVGSTLTVAGDVLANNVALVSSVNDISGGGALCNRNGATLVVTDSTFAGNQSLGEDGGGSAYGGALLNRASTATVRTSIFLGNRAVGGDGGEVRGGQFLVGLGVGGGIKDSGGGVLTVEGSVFQGNQAIGGSGGSGGKGAALYLVDNGAGGGSPAPVIQPVS